LRNWLITVNPLADSGKANVGGSRDVWVFWVGSPESQGFNRRCTRWVKWGATGVFKGKRTIF
jgi:phage gp37-like protein